MGVTMRRVVFCFLLLIPAFLGAEENSESLDSSPGRHFIIETDHVLGPGEQGELAARGVEIQHIMAGNRYLVRTQHAGSLTADPLVRAVVPYSASNKVDRTAYGDTTRGEPYLTLRLIFHDDVTFGDAQRAIEAVAGTLARPLAVDFELPHRLVAQVPPVALA